MADFSGKVALVTGGARGLGQATAVELASRGARVAVADRKPEMIVETVERCSKVGSAAMAFVFDQAKADSVEACVAEVAGHYGQIDLLFANAGTGRFAPIVDMKKSDWDIVIQVNLNGTFYVCQEVAKRMIQRGKGGKIVLTSSSGARVIADQLGAYCASKAAVILLTQGLALELAPYGITVNAYAPGIVDTGMTDNTNRALAKYQGLAVDEVVRQRLSRVPLGRFGTPEDIAGLVAFLVSEDSSYITGQCFPVGGGLFMR